jgi:predicted dehydrogenase
LIGVVGLGYWGPNLARNFAELGTLTWLCDLDEELRATFAARYPAARVSDSYEAMLEDPGVQGVVIATPVPTHYGLAKQALEAGKHVLVEKPPAMRGTEIDELVAIAAERDLVLMPGHLLLYHPGVRKLKELIDGGELGEVLCVYGNRQNLGIVRTNENALWSLGVHDLSVILYLLDEEPAEAVAHGRASRTSSSATYASRAARSRTCTCRGSTRTRCGRSRSSVGTRWSSSTTWSSSAR